VPSRDNAIIEKDRVMALQIFLSSSLRRHRKDYDPGKGLVIPIEPNTTVAEVCDRLELPKSDIRVVMVNGKGKTLDFKLEGDERVALFPPLGGG
jgi:sulfur carrier protein ThiS